MASYGLRHIARRRVVQALYQMHFLNITEEDLYAQYADWIEDNILHSKMDENYFHQLLKGILKHKKEVDAYLVPCLDRPLERLSPVELAILRLGVYELRYEKSVPCKVVINEALELSKIFGMKESFRYVNGVLDKCLKILSEDNSNTSSD